MGTNSTINCLVESCSFHTYNTLLYVCVFDYFVYSFYEYYSLTKELMDQTYDVMWAVKTFLEGNFYNEHKKEEPFFPFLLLMMKDINI